jgi:hypothetical protein
MVLSRSIKSQRGISLISLMVGVTISLITAVAMLTMFRHAIKITADTTKMSKQDGERSSAMTIAPMLLQDAGFGINNAAVGSNIVALSGATLTGATLAGTAGGANANAVVWRHQTGATLQCSALLATPEKGLSLLGPITCAALADWSTASWTAQPLASLGTFNFILTTTPCTQYGYASNGQATVKISSDNAINKPINSLSCLSNLTVTP